MKVPSFLVCVALLASAALGGSSTYDYIIVGAGSSGSIAASKLATSAGSPKVLLLERGYPSSEKDPISTLPLQTTPRFESRIWDSPSFGEHFYTERNPGSLGKRLPLTIPNGPGGSSVHTPSYLRPDLSDFDTWGISSWSSANLEPFFAASEAHTAPGPHNGYSGNIPIVQGPDGSLTSAFLQSAAAAYLPTVDFSQGGSTLGAGSLFHAQTPGYFRVDAFSAYISPMTGFLPNLEVVYGATVTQVIFDQYSTPMVAYGVQYLLHGQTQPVTVYCDKEVILAAGALGSPKILELSGIGKSEVLSAFGIGAVVDLPVGENLILKPKVDVYHLTNQIYPEQQADGLFNSTNIYQYASQSGGYFAQHIESAVAASSSSSLKPDFAVYHSSAIPPFNYPQNTIRSSCVVVAPYSRGTTHISSKNPADFPKVSPNVFGDQRDLINAISCVEFTRVLSDLPPLRNSILTELLPSSSVNSTFELAYFVQNQVLSTNEIMGTCKMGLDGDATAVVNPQLLVQGFANLRVADASVLPEPVRFGTTATEFMIGQMVASLATQANYMVNIDFSRGMNITMGFHKFEIVNDVQDGNSPVCPSIKGKAVHVEPGTCDYDEAVLNVLQSGAGKVWIGPKGTSCRTLSSNGDITFESCSQQLPVLCRG